MKYYDVMLPVPAGGIYTYICETELKAGQRVEVPLGRRELCGIVTGENIEPRPDITYREIKTIKDDEPVFGEKYLKFIRMISDYYCVEVGGVLNGILSGAVLESQRTNPEVKSFERRDITLNVHQIPVYDAISSELNSGFSVHLVYGVTGSGKTEIFIELAKQVIAQGKKVMYLVPEISLTPQIENRLSARIGFDVMSYHSKKTPKKRNDTFWAFAKGDLKMVLGARSALFLPSDDIGLIIVDEEHESSYKQEDTPPYHLRDMAVLYGKLLDIPVILASATPSLESWQNAVSGRYRLHTIPCRPDTDMPDIEIVDMKKEEPIGGVLSERLYNELYKTIENGEQAILLINRKGYSHTLYCRSCGEMIMCSNCSVAVTYYKSKGLCKCNYCSQEIRRPKCHKCGSDDISEYGAGTEKVAEALENLFEKKILRLDTESATTYNQLSKMLKDFETGEYSIMAGTQLVAKGLDFANVTLAGVINIDNMFGLPDFRSKERAYQLLVQVSGRAGRASKKGRVIIQTNAPETDVFTHLNCTDTGFYEAELIRRKLFNYPPFVKMCRVTLSHTKEETAKEAAHYIYGVLKSVGGDAEIFYPAQAPVYKISNRYRYGMVIKTKTNSEMSRLINIASKSLKENMKSTLRVRFDRDPQFFM
ncbi:replication restart helicase PriA [Seleniivibrio woodruffii]|uniref:Replication restart protein PriA n=1 Tax=Seleniivibrio woodruffii TaxID=1078050 RepID=A0A4R1KA76_9BACT|nr:primosomal protein N' [Seleniivibrio woodruffii]TCK60937.1 replication restart DNA helicase PriA [Seleniivibrio woodruffii]TVZ36567.1 replication restart DNA helicase PriA [Seleniivibrio woodruffii]